MTKRFPIYFGLLFPLWLMIACVWAAPVKAQPTRRSANYDDRSIHVIATVEGKADVKRPGRAKYEPAIFGTLLQPGDEVRVEPSSRATVVCADLKKRDVPGGFSGAPCPARKAVGRKKPGFQRRPDGLVREPRGYEPDSFPIILSPRKTELLNPRPTLRWTPVAGATTYKVTLRGSNLEWVENVLSKTEIVYPENAPALKAGNDYKLIVEANDRSSSEARIPGLGFTVLPGGEAKEMRREAQKIREMGLPDAPTRLLIAHLYSSSDLYAEAIEELEKLPKTLSEPSPVRLLGDLYLAVGLNRRAEEQYLRAVELSETANDEEGQALAHFALGMIYQEALGNTSAANIHLTAALQSYKKLGDQQKAEDIEERLAKLK